MSKPFRETAVGKFLTKTAPDVLTTVGDVLPSNGVFGIVKNLISQHPIMTDVEKAEALSLAQTDELELEFEKEQNRAAEAEQSALTERLKIDMTSDSWLSKNIRPASLAFLMIAVTIFCLLDSANAITVKQEWVQLYKELLMLAIAFYFGGRSFEKIKQITR